jgi:hypothetical protein
MTFQGCFLPSFVSFGKAVSPNEPKLGGVQPMEGSVLSFLKAE